MSYRSGRLFRFSSAYATKYMGSLDQTTRVHGAVISPAPTADPGKVWHELARPQVHGYDLVGATWLSPWTFASVADEKVARVFEAPRGFVETAKCLGVRGIVESSVSRLYIILRQAKTPVRSTRITGQLGPVCLLWDCRTRRSAKVCFHHSP
jgi:hypothetical protein